MKKRSHGEHGGTEEDADLFEVRSNRRAVVSAVRGISRNFSHRGTEEHEGHGVKGKRMVIGAEQMMPGTV